MVNYTKKSRFVQSNTALNLQEILALITGRTNSRPRHYRRGYIVCCPAHNDKNPSLSIAEGSDGTILLKCFSGCKLEDICSSIGIQICDLFPKKTRG